MVDKIVNFPAGSNPDQKKKILVRCSNWFNFQEMREIIMELMKEKSFHMSQTFEYSKTKATNIIGLSDQVTNYNDPKFFSFTVKW